MKHQTLITAAAGFMLSTSLALAAPEVVDGPGADPQCFAPLSEDTQYFQWPAKEGPYKVALVNGFIANDWRVQMIRVAKAFANQPEVAADLEEFKVVSVGEDIAAQIAAANNFIDQGFDAIIVNANNTSAFGSVVRKANAAGVVVLSFDNVIDDPMNIQINVDQVGLGRTAGEFLLSKTDADPAKFLFVRGPAGQPVDIARATGFQEVLDASGRNVEVTEVVGNWAPGDGQKVTADAIAAGGMFDGIYVQGGSQGPAQAMIDAGKFIVPMSGEDENAFRQMCNEYHDKGMVCQSGGTGPAQSAITIKTAIAALKGEVIPQSISLPTSISFSPYKVGSEVFPDLPGSLFTGNNFPDCNIGFTNEEISSQSGDNN
ncbi:substrate-binding domain-containing protein [Hoeflea sp. YIM 152468]|uniref:substrate-binding domain-containing protein n=1 Tax=Hoeflea sp. YIM 152468 TaxID=3031759 RepID=UPI0023DB9E6F|nr:substrate-binding domain-containing protein [Hoeflea sp. YIM 152468]MDF1610194.1 substrate-binding domain-containing protein [Hoeflea sp. YIM 152468]